MSVEAVKQALRHRTGNPAWKAVLLVIAEHTGADGAGCIARATTIAAEADCDERTVRRATKALEAAGILTRCTHLGHRGWAVNMGDPIDLRGDRESTPPDSESPPEPDSVSTGPDFQSNEPDRESGPSEPPGNHQEPPGLPPNPQGAEIATPALVLVPPSEPPAQRDDTEAEFTEWYARYPRKESPKAALRAYRTARKTATADELLEGLARSIAAWTAEKRERRFLPQPATWLNGGRWRDQLDAPTGTERLSRAEIRRRAVERAFGPQPAARGPVMEATAREG